MAYTLARNDLDAITDVDVAFSTERYLPTWAEVPEEFRRGNLYTMVAQALFYSTPLPEAEMAFREGFTDMAAPGALNRCVRAHLQSWGPKHEHKIAGVGLMIAQACELRPASASSSSSSND